MTSPAPAVHVDRDQYHLAWDRAIEPVATVASGTVVEIEMLDASCGQITAASTADDLRTLDFSRVNPAHGPIAVEGAEPGDSLEIELLDFQPAGWGWTASIPGFGLLADDFPNPHLHHYKLGRTHCQFREDILIPYEPFCGVMGVAPREPGRLNTIPPRENAGNIDIRHLTPGARVMFPVLAPGALFSCGDCHSAQGDGEVNGTGIETPMTVRLRLNLLKGVKTPELRFVTPARQKLTVADAGGYFVTTAHGPDLFKDAQQAMRYMIDYLSSEHNMTREQAYCLCGAAVDLKISEIVDAPNWIVSAYLPLSLFVKKAAPQRAAAKAKPKAKAKATRKLRKK